MHDNCRCGLPITHLSISLHHCETCFGYVARAGMHRQADGDRMETVWDASAKMGPFDSWEDIRAWLEERLIDPAAPPAHTLGSQPSD
jgi:hypothetical protein